MRYVILTVLGIYILKVSNGYTCPSVCKYTKIICNAKQKQEKNELLDKTEHAPH